MRIEGWETRLDLVIEKHSTMPFEWGVSDCFIFASECLDAVTDHNPLVAHTDYTSQLDAYKRLKSAGFEMFADAISSVFYETHPAFGNRGDIGIIERDGEQALGVYSSAGFVCKSKTGVMYEPITSVTLAYLVI